MIPRHFREIKKENRCFGYRQYDPFIAGIITFEMPGSACAE